MVTYSYDDDLLDREEYDLRLEFYLKFKRTFMHTLAPVPGVDSDTIMWHISDLLGAADSFADVVGKTQLRDVLWHLFSSEEYWKQ